MKLRIKSNGTAAKTEIVNENGERLGLVQKITWSVDVDNPVAKCTIELLGVPLDVEAENSFSSKPVVDSIFSLLQNNVTSSEIYDRASKTKTETKHCGWVNTEFDKTLTSVKPAVTVNAKSEDLENEEIIRKTILKLNQAIDSLIVESKKT